MQDAESQPTLSEPALSPEQPKSKFVTVTASIGLLQRHNWARILTIAMLALLIPQSVIGGAFVIVLIIATIPHVGSEALPGLIGGMAGGLGSNLMYLVLFGFVAWKLTRVEIRAEFH